MSLSIARLRVWLLVSATLLVLVIAGFLGYARYRTHRFLAGLPGRLGIDIRRETNGYTYSQSIKGKTVMTLHAAKAVEHQDGKLTLHDVGMILYGRRQERADRISGAEFEYDPKAGVVRAVGEVHIDLQAPAPAGARTRDGKSLPIPSVNDEVGDESRRIVHVKTSGLVYLQKLGVAATDQDLEFLFGGMTGHAIGAEYNADTGVLILQSAVKVNGLQHGRPVVLTASHAEMERTSQVARLTQAKYVTPEQTVRGDHAIVHLRSDGSPEQIEAEGNVALEGSGTGMITAPRADVLLNAAGQAQRAHLFGAGGVHYADDASVSRVREAKGRADEAQVAFDTAGQPATVLLTGAVDVNERVRSSDAVSSAWRTREATVGRMTLTLAAGAGGGKRELRQVDASGAAHVMLGGGAGAGTSEIAGDTLRGNFTGTGKAMLLLTIEGSGHTSLRQVGAKGREQTSAGDALRVDLRAASKKASVSQAGSEEIVRAVQTGHVVMTSRSAAKPGKDVPAMMTTRAMADLGVYDGDADHLTLTGHAQVVDQGSTVAANRIVIEHGSGDATAEGAVKANYLQPDSTEPVHVLADRAAMAHDAGLVVFRGGASPVRMWQGASQVEAPTIELDQAKRSMNAHGDAGAVAPVHAVLVGKRTTRAGNTLRPAVVRIASQTMVYLEALRQVDFAGGVKIEDAEGTLRARQATAFLQAAPAVGSVASKKDPGTSGAFFGGGVERIVASGKVELEQPGRRAAGEQLVYTASDALFVLTGTPAALPKLIDEVQGTVTGTKLSFHAGDDSVVVTGDRASPGDRVHTVTRVKQK